MKQISTFKIGDGFLRQAMRIVLVFSVLLVGVISAQAQQTTGTVRGNVRDQAGAVVPGATVTLTESATKNAHTATADSDGAFQFSNLPVGNYTATVTAPGGSNFSTLTVNDVKVVLNQVTDLGVVLQPGATTASVTVSAVGAELVDTTSLNLSKDFSSRQVVDLAQTGQGAGVYNLALISPNVSSSGGVGLGVGGSVGGQRPRNNNFVVDGIDNNDKTVSGPQIYVSPESVAEFNLLTNQASAEFARSTGGQFITVTKSGSNDFHGSIFEFMRNKQLNALDNLQKVAGTTRETDPRFDQNRYGFNIGGPLYIPWSGDKHYAPWSGKNRLFFFFQLEKATLGQAASPGGLVSPTAAGYAILSALPGNNANNLTQLKTFLPAAPVANAPSIVVCNALRDSAGKCAAANQVTVPVGSLSFAAPNFQNNLNWVLNFDFNQSDKTQHHSRFIFNRNRQIDTAGSSPSFFDLIPVDGRLFSYTLTHSFNSKFTNETRLAYRRYVQNIPVPNVPFPGLDSFPNIDFDDLNTFIGPDGNAPQFTIENSYQVVNQSTYLMGNHSFKFGVDWRDIISPQSFVQRQRGEYEYPSLDQYLRDVQPVFGERTVGASPYYGNQHLFYGFFQDDWKLRPRFTLNLGINYVYQQVPGTARLQTVNSISSVPGLLTFGEPKAQKANFAPRIGMAWAPNYTSGWKNKIFGNPDESSIRLSFAMAYDTIVDNLYILSLAPQFNQTIDVGTNFPGTPLVTPNFLATGGIPLSARNSGALTAAQARAATSAWIPDQQVPYSMSWGLTYQREFHKNWALEVRYLGSKGVHLPTQNRINIQNRVNSGPGGFLPTFLTRPSQAQLDAMTTTLAAIKARPNIIPAYSSAGFTSPVIGFLANGNSDYNSGSASLTRRFSKGFQMSAAYTWSHLIDDTTAEVFSTVLSPRRVQDFQNLKAEKADSALDRRQRFVMASLYDLPFFNSSSNHFVKTFLGGWSLAGTLTFESGELATVLDGSTDANLNGDSAGDRTIVNVGGVKGTGSGVTSLTRTDGQIVGYLAVNPNAQYIQTGQGALSNAGRNTLHLPGINNLDFSIFKNFAFGNEGRFKFQLRADMYNAFNHPNYVPGSVDGVEPIATTGVGAVNTVNANSFNQPSQVFSSHPRVVQIGARFNF